MQKALLLFLAPLWTLAAGCRGQTSAEPPVHLNPNMDDQAYFQGQEPNPFFPDQMAMRPEVPGTIPVGGLKDDAHFYRGMQNGQLASSLPLPLDNKLLARGQERFNIYCAVCHDRAGTGTGIVVRRGMTPPPSFHDDRIRAMPVGQIFQVVTQGVRTMPSYAAQIPPEDRWAIVAYVRALQLSKSASLQDIPAEIRGEKGWTR